MRTMIISAAVLGALFSLTSAHAAPEITWKKSILDTEFRAEGVAVADVNKDGRKDVMAGNLWYEAPNWTPHEIAPVSKFNGATGYSNCFGAFALDVDGDGWTDQVLVGMPGDKVTWRRNPGRGVGHWTEHPMWRSACNESQVVGRLLGGKSEPVFVWPYDESTMAWYELNRKPSPVFTAHDVSTAKGPGTQRFSHGLGVGDMNGDRRPDILTAEGWYEAPADPRKGPWPFVKADLGPACAHMHSYDVNGDGNADVFSSSAHDRGVWWHERQGATNQFVRHTIDESWTQAHVLELVDMNRDGLPDLVTGKRFWAHGPNGDPDSGGPALLLWYELKRRGPKPEWVRHEIDNDSGVGTQFVVEDMNRDGRPDVVTANKKGVFVFVQSGGK